MRKFLWILVAVIGAFAVGGVAVQRGETLNAMWIVVAAVCVYAIGYRFYSAWVVARVLSADPNRATPALRLNNGRPTAGSCSAITSRRSPGPAR